MAQGGNVASLISVVEKAENKTSRSYIRAACRRCRNRVEVAVETEGDVFKKGKLKPIADQKVLF